MGCPISLLSGVFPVKRLLQQPVSTEITEVGMFQEAVPRSGLAFLTSVTWAEGSPCKRRKSKARGQTTGTGIEEMTPLLKLLNS